MSAPMGVDEIVLISAEGYERRYRELGVLRNETRRELSARLREARQDGDLGDNPALQQLLEEQALLERRIALLEVQLAAAEIVEPANDGNIGLGSVVRVRGEEGETLEFELVGPLESDVSTGRVSDCHPRRPGARGPAGRRSCRGEYSQRPAHAGRRLGRPARTS